MMLSSSLSTFLRRKIAVLGLVETVECHESNTFYWRHYRHLLYIYIYITINGTTGTILPVIYGTLLSFTKNVLSSCSITAQHGRAQAISVTAVS